MNDLVSVIVPAYNVEPYIEACLCSALEQSYPNMEIVVIDDGSTDATGELCEKIRRENGTVRVAHTENRGVSAARNLGLTMKNGKYFTFLDADDRLERGAIEHMQRLAVEADADIVITQLTGRGQQGRIMDGEMKVLDHEQALVKFLSFPNRSSWHTACGKLFRSASLDMLRFEMGRRIMEDDYYLFHCLLFSRKTLVCSRESYICREVMSSASRGAFSEKYFDITYFAQKKYDYIRRYHDDLISYAEYSLFRGYLMLAEKLVYARDAYADDYQKCMAYIRSNRSRYFRGESATNRMKIVTLTHCPWLYRLILYMKRMLRTAGGVVHEA